MRGDNPSGPSRRTDGREISSSNEVPKELNDYLKQLAKAYPDTDRFIVNGEPYDVTRYPRRRAETYREGPSRRAERRAETPYREDSRGRAQTFDMGTGYPPQGGYTEAIRQQWAQMPEKSEPQGQEMNHVAAWVKDQQERDLARERARAERAWYEQSKRERYDGRR